MTLGFFVDLYSRWNSLNIRINISINKNNYNNDVWIIILFTIQSVVKEAIKPTLNYNYYISKHSKGKKLTEAIVFQHKYSKKIFAFLCWYSIVYFSYVKYERLDFRVAWIHYGFAQWWCNGFQISMKKKIWKICVPFLKYWSHKHALACLH